MGNVSCVQERSSEVVGKREWTRDRALGGDGSPLGRKSMLGSNCCCEPRQTLGSGNDVTGLQSAFARSSHGQSNPRVAAHRIFHEIATQGAHTVSAREIYNALYAYADCHREELSLTEERGKRAAGEEAGYFMKQTQSAEQWSSEAFTILFLWHKELCTKVPNLTESALRDVQIHQACFVECVSHALESDSGVFKVPVLDLLRELVQYMIKNRKAIKELLEVMFHNLDGECSTKLLFLSKERLLQLSGIYLRASIDSTMLSSFDGLLQVLRRDPWGIRIDDFVEQFISDLRLAQTSKRDVFTKVISSCAEPNPNTDLQTQLSSSATLKGQLGWR